MTSTVCEKPVWHSVKAFAQHIYFLLTVRACPFAAIEIAG